VKKNHQNVGAFSKSLEMEIDRKNQKKVDELERSKDGLNKYTKTDDESFVRRAKERFGNLERERTGGSLDQHGNYWSNW
jgi:hypothetical protein